MKRLITISILFALVMCLLSGCGADTAPTASAPDAVTDIISEMELTQSAAVDKEKYLGKSEFADFLAIAEPQFVIPGLNEAVIPQGMDYCAANGLIYISNYYSVDKPSVITAVDAESGELMAEYYLYNEDGTDFKSHVGGLAVCGDKLYVSARLDNDGSYQIAEFPIEALSLAGHNELKLSELISVPVSPSFLNCSEGYLWVGNFYHPDAKYGLSPNINYTTEGYGCYILGYSTDRELKPESGYAVPDLIIAAPDRIQGFTALGERGVLLSQSYGRKNNSTIYNYALELNDEADTETELMGIAVPTYVLSEDKLIAAYTAMPMTEALCIGAEGKPLLLFESGALHYEDGKYRNDKVWQLDF